MKNLYLLFFAAVSSLGLVAQPTLSPTVIASTGGYASSSAANASLSYTVGEMTMVQTFTGGNNILTQGFQQPDTVIVNGLINITQDAYGSLVVYPNPAVDNFYYGFQLPEPGRVDVALFNELGQKMADIYHGNYTNGNIIAQANSSSFAAGMYFLTLNFTATTDGKTYVTTKKVQIVR